MASRPNYVAAHVLGACVLAFALGYAAVASVPAARLGTEAVPPADLAVIVTAPVFPALFLFAVRVGSRFLMTFAFAAYFAIAVWLAGTLGNLAPTLAAALLAVALGVGWVSARSGPQSGVTVGPTFP